MDVRQILKDLTVGAGVSGCEYEIAPTAEKYLEKYGRVHIDTLGNVILEKDGKGDGILLDAHTDMVGMIVTSITPEGFLRVDACGHIDTRPLGAQQVTIHGKEPLVGVVISTPPHLQKGDGEHNGMKMSDVLIDTGLPKEKVLELVGLGDRVTVNSEFTQLLGDRASCCALDDRAGMASLIYAMEILEEKGCDKKVTVSFSTREEVGGSGAKTAAFNASAKELIAVDVSFADTPDSNSEECGELSKGPMIGVSSSLDYEMSQKFIDTAEKCGIPYQLEIMGGRTGTNADSMTVAKGGFVSGLISIPLRYMHTGIEVVSVADVENTGRLIAEYIAGGNENA